MPSQVLSGTRIHTGPLPKGSDYGRTSHAIVVILVIVVAAGISAAQKFAKTRRIKKAQEARDKASGQAMFLILLTYLKPLDEIYQLLHHHDAHLDRNRTAGLFLASGRTVSQAGGVILVRGTSLREVKELADKDPLVTEGAARYEIVEFQLRPPTLTGDSYRRETVALCRCLAPKAARCPTLLRAWPCFVQHARSRRISTALGRWHGDTSLAMASERLGASEHGRALVVEAVA